MAKGGARQAKRRQSLWSKRGFNDLDQRLLEAKEENRLIRELSEHVGTPTVPQKLLIKRTARNLIMLNMLERIVLESHDLKDLQARQLIALTNSVRLNLVALGLERPDAKGIDPIAYLEQKRKAAA